jgi:hypothetical protein
MASCRAAHVRQTAMKKGYFVGLVFGIVVPPRGTRFAEDVALVRGDFADYLRGLGFSAFTVEYYLRRLMRVAHWLHEHPRRLPLSKLTRKAIPNLLNDCLEGRCFETVINYRKALFHWLRFQSRYAKPAKGAFGNRGLRSMSIFSEHIVVSGRRQSSIVWLTHRLSYVGSSAVNRPTGHEFMRAISGLLLDTV